MEVLRVKSLSKNFGALYALRDISFSVQAGERLAIIGPNGAGKTTLFNVLDGELSATAGQIYLFGQEITNVAAYRRAHLGLGRSSQINSCFPPFTVLNNVLLALQGTQASRYQMFRPLTVYKHLFVKAEELLMPVDLWEKRNDLVQNIGYGEQRKLEVVLSLASEPKLLLLDEPTAGLTGAEGAGLIDSIRNLGRDITIIIVAHDMDLVFRVAERIIALHYGQIIAEGTPEQIQADSRVKENYMGVEEGIGNAGAS